MIRDQRAALGITQTAIAEAVGVSRAAVSLWESSRRAPTADKLHGLFDVLQFSDRQALDYVKACSDLGQL